MSEVERSPEIDRFRGLAIVLMVFANYFAGISWVPAWLKHAPDIGFTCIDAIAPLFIFAIALTYGASYRRSIASRGGRETALRFVRRYAALIGIGAILSAGEVWFEQGQGAMNWGVLQAIGVAGLLALCFMGFSPWIRLLAGGLILVVYQILLDRFWLETVLDSSHGGFPGSISWGGMLIIASGIADLINGKGEERAPTACKKIATSEPKIVALKFIAAGLIFVAMGAALGQLIPISKNRVSATYDILSIGISAVIYGLASSSFGLRKWSGKMRVSDGSAMSNSKITQYRQYGPITQFLVWWGRNPIFLYILHLFVLGIFALPTAPWWYTNAHPALAVFQFLFIVGILTSIARALYQKKIIINL
ncbi:MAG TPA: heparan-alpha-glucosaminide N-acetyltransferase domain-containing protein [Rectinema sp.]|nr:heparan-alpha-glucosaminide N-acetyltransferase domain-containing protein [Rectinema sp.]